MVKTNNSEQFGTEIDTEELTCLFSEYKTKFTRNAFNEKFKFVSSGVEKYEEYSYYFRKSLLEKEQMTKINEDDKFVKIDDKTELSYKDLFGEVASVGQSYFTEDDFGQLLNLLFDQNKEDFELSEDGINKIEQYFSQKAKKKKEEKKNDKSLKQYAIPKAATCRLLMALFPNYFCPIPTPNKVYLLFDYLSGDKFIDKDEIKKGIKVSGENWLKKWCIYNNLLYHIFKETNSPSKGTNPVQPWNAIVRYGQEEKREEIKKLLEENKNIILTGAPGTGKTYMAKQIAVEMTGNNSNVTISSTDVEDNFKELKNQGFVDFVQFHPSYDYTDFVEGLRPSGNANSFVRMDGIFKKFCEKADFAKKDEQTKNNKYIFIIDEINRGEISKIFGELFFSIDPGYRGEKGLVNTQYQNLIPSKIKVKENEVENEKNNPDPFINGFYVPDNVYIIGTMNDIDRSVESMDFAFRRRFAFKEIKAEESKSMLWDGDNSQILEEVMNSINKKLIEPQFGLSEAYQIGASYFNKIKKKDGNNDYNYETELKTLWEYHIKGLLFEYLRGKPNATDLLKQLEKAYFEKVQEEADSENDETQG